MMSTTMVPGASRSGSTGMASFPFMPSGVALITTSNPCGSGGPERALQRVSAATDAARLASSTFIDVGYGQLACACGRDRECDGAPGAAGTDEKHRLIRRMVAFPLHSKNAADAIEYCADPATVWFAADDVERADLTSGRMQFVDKFQHPLFVRHGDEQAGEVAHRSCTGNKGGQVLRLHPEGNTSGVDALFSEDLIQQLWRPGCRQWIAH
jgi:hypothetical protein